MDARYYADADRAALEEELVCALEHVESLRAQLKGGYGDRTPRQDLRGIAEDEVADRRDRAEVEGSFLPVPAEHSL